MMAQFNELAAAENLPWKLEDIIPKVLTAGEQAGTLTEEGAKLVKFFSSTAMANTEVPAETFPVRCATLLVATIPVPASPSGGHTGIPAFSVPDTSRSLAPSLQQLYF